MIIRINQINKSIWGFFVQVKVLAVTIWWGQASAPRLEVVGRSVISIEIAYSRLYNDFMHPGRKMEE
jgi:hypothetical protein